MLPLFVVTASLSPPPQSLAGKTVAVVGGGVGGMVSAGIMARRGAKVTVFERRPTSGGRLGETRLGPAGEWRFDTGPSLLLMPDVYRQTFELLGDPEPLEMEPLPSGHMNSLEGMQQPLPVAAPGPQPRWDHQPPPLPRPAPPVAAHWSPVHGRRTAEPAH